MSDVPVLDDQLAVLQKSFPGATVTKADGVLALVKVPEVPLPPGWNRRTTTVYFVAPTGFPMAKPDCFWAQPDLRLFNEAMPQSSAFNVVPGLGAPHLWFSWHLQTWNPLTDTLITYVRVIRDRFLKQN